MPRTTRCRIGVRDACGVWRQLCQAQSLKILKVNYSKSIYVVEHRVCPCDLLTLIYLLGSSCTGPCDGTSPVCAPSPPTATCPLLRARSHRLTPNGAVDARGDAKEQPPAPRGHTAERATWRGRGRAAVSAVGHDRRQPRVAFGRGVRDERIQRGRACLERDGIGHAWRGKYSGDEKVRLTRCTILRCPPAGSPQHEGAVYGYCRLLTLHTQLPGGSTAIDASGVASSHSYWMLAARCCV